MKTKALLSAVSIFFLASCSSEDIVSTLNEESHAETQNYDVSIDIPSFKYEGTTRTSFTESSTGIDINWSANDKVGIFPESGFQNCFTVSGGSGSSSASFDGGNWALKKGKKYYAYYPFSKANFDNSIESVPLTYEGQCIPRINKTDNLAEFDYMFAEGTQPEGEKLNFSFSHKGCVLKVVLNMPEVAKYTKLTVSTDGEFPIASNYNILTNVRTTLKTCQSFDIDLDNMNIIKAGKATFYLMLPPCDLSSNTLTFTLYTESNSYQTQLEAKKHQIGGAYLYTTTESMDDDAVQEGYYTFNAVSYPMPEFVDLGLPSGTKWANMDLCSSDIYTIEIYDDYIPSDSQSVLPNSINDFLADKSFGLPSASQCEELETYCSLSLESLSECTNYEGWHAVYNYIIKLAGPNGNYIYIPCTTAATYGDYHMIYYRTSTRNSYLSFMVDTWSSLIRYFEQSETPSCDIDTSPKIRYRFVSQ